jgi:hypothetical protein
MVFDIRRPSPLYAYVASVVAAEQPAPVPVFSETSRPAWLNPSHAPLMPVTLEVRLPRVSYVYVVAPVGTLVHEFEETPPTVQHSSSAGLNCWVTLPVWAVFSVFVRLSAGSHVYGYEFAGGLAQAAVFAEPA